jgi:hypothetical protein
LVLPLAVLGKETLTGRSRISILGFFGLLVFLSAPVDLYYWIGWPLRPHVRWLVINWGILSLPTYAVTLVGVWLAIRIARQYRQPAA